MYTKSMTKNMNTIMNTSYKCKYYILVAGVDDSIDVYIKIIYIFIIIYINI